MGVNSLPKTVTRQRRGCDLNPGPSVPESSTLTTRLPSHPSRGCLLQIGHWQPSISITAICCGFVVQIVSTVDKIFTDIARRAVRLR